MQRDDLNHAGLLTNGNGSSNGASAHATAVAPLEPRFVIEQGPAEPPPSDNSMQLIRAILAAFRRRWFLATSLGLICGAVAAIAAWSVLPAPYTAFGEIRIYAQQPKLIFGAGERSNFDVYKGTHARLLKGYFVLQAALREPEVAQCSLIRNQAHPVEWLEHNLQVFSPGYEFFRVALSGENPGELATVVNAVIRAYMVEVVEKERLARNSKIDDLRKVHDKLEREIETVRSAHRRQAEAMQVPDAEMGSKKQEHLLDLYLLMRQEYANIDFELVKAEVQLATKEQLQKDPEAVKIPEHMLEAQLIQMAEIQRAGAKVAQAEEQLAKAREVLREGHSRLAPFESTFKTAEQEYLKLREEMLPEARRQIIEGMRAQQQASASELQDQIAILKAKRTHLEEEIEKIQLEERRTGTLNRSLMETDKELEQKEKIAAAILDQKQRLEIEADSPVGIEIFRDAEAPHARDTKKKVTGTAGAGFGMFGLIVGGIVLLELRSRRISSLDEVADGLKVRVMGSLPIMPRFATSANGRKNARSAFWHSVLTESIDATRTMLLREARDESHKVVMIASAMGGEGKTTLSCHLATSLARARRKVLLVDCDMRRPNVNRVFGLSLTPGLCEVLRGEAKLEDAIQTSSTTGLSILPAGKVNHEVLQILAQDGIDSVLKELREQFDFVIVDSSPTLPVTDSLLIAQHVDGVIFSIRRDVSRAAKVAAAMQRMGMLGVPLLGAVVIGLDDGSYGYRYGGYGYGYRNAYNSLPQAR